MYLNLRNEAKFKMIESTKYMQKKIFLIPGLFKTWWYSG